MMRKGLMIIALGGLAVGTLSAVSPVQAQETFESTGPYSVTTTTVGALLDNPATSGVLQRLIPDVYNNEMFRTMGRSLTLKEIQQYEPVALSDESLAKIQAEFDKFPGSDG